VRFVIVRDNDGADCRELKTSLVGLVPAARREHTLVRIACQELEAWYFGDPASLAAAFQDPELSSLGTRARFRVPDEVQQPAAALADLVPQFQKISGARAMGRVLRREGNASRSFQVFLEGIDKLMDRRASLG
jgi:hypothetical protein